MSKDYSILPNHNLNISRLSASDYPEIIEIWEASVRATHSFLSENDINFYKPVILKYALPDVELYGIIKNHKIQGFMGTSQDKVEMLFLHPKCRGQGLGRHFIEFALNKLKIFKIDVNEENPQAIGFYQHLGYRTISRDEFDGNGKPHPILHLEYPHE